MKPSEYVEIFPKKPVWEKIWHRNVFQITTNDTVFKHCVKSFIFSLYCQKCHRLRGYFWKKLLSLNGLAKSMNSFGKVWYWITFCHNDMYIVSSHVWMVKIIGMPYTNHKPQLKSLDIGHKLHFSIQCSLSCLHHKELPKRTEQESWLVVLSFA